MRGFVLVALCACGSSPTTYEVVSGPRDWAKAPAIVERGAPGTVWAVSDVHGGYDRFAMLLATAGVTAGVPASPGEIKWAAGDSVLVVTGDMIDKGMQGLEVLDALMALETSAAGQGGQVIVAVGNHEAEFFANPTNDKAENGIDNELHADGIDPVAIASGADPRGAWLRARPFGAKVGDWFFAHAGQTKGRGVAELEAAIRADVEANDYRGAEVVGSDSLLEARDWYGAGVPAALGVAHVVFGHDPHALGADGAIAVGQGGALLRIDTGMSPAVDYSHGELLRVRGELADAITASGDVRHLLP